MGYRLRMNGEFRDWLREMRSTSPVEALAVGYALAALAERGPAVAPNLVTDLDGQSPPGWSGSDAADQLDHAYERLLELLQTLRREHADAGTSGRPTGAIDDLAALDDEVQVFRARKESAKARLTADRVSQQVTELLDEERPCGDSGDQARVGAAEREIGDLLAAASALQDRISRRIGPAASSRPPTDLLELRPGMPAGSPARILFAVQPPGTALLLAVLYGAEAISSVREDAITLASALLERARSGSWPQPGDVYDFADVGSFMAEFFPAPRP